MPLDQSPEPAPPVTPVIAPPLPPHPPGYVRTGYFFALAGAILFSTKAVAIKLVPELIIG